MLYFTDGFECGGEGDEKGVVEFSRFPNKEIRVMLKSDVRDRDCVVVQSLCRDIEENLFRALLLGDALKENGCRSVRLIVPFMAYSLMNRHFDNEPISARVVAKVISTVFDEVWLWEVHSPTVCEFFDIPCYNRSVLLEMVEKALELHGVDCVVAPDKGSLQRAIAVSRNHDLKLVVGSKVRDLVSTKIESLEIEGGVDGMDVLIVDDMVNTGGTVVRLSKLLRDKGAKSVGLVTAHWLPVKGNWKKVCGAVDWVVTSNSCVKHEDMNAIPKNAVVVNVRAGKLHF